MATIEGSCHCGNIRWRFTPSLPATELPARRCTCAFCAKHEALYTSDPGGRLSVEIGKSDYVNVYRFADRTEARAARQGCRGCGFGTRTTEPQVCRRCGVMPLILAHIEGRLYGVVNLAAAEDLAIPPERIQNVNFEHQTAEERDARRARTWIAQVSVTSC